MEVKKKKVNDSHYYVMSYFQKSLHLLFPLITKKQQEGVINTFLFANELEEDILEYVLICEMKKKVEINEELQKYLLCTYETEDNTDLLIFDMSHISDEVDKFLMGQYSQYNQTSKDSILIHHKWEYRGKPLSVEEIKKNKQTSALHFYVILYPDDFKENVAEDMVYEYNLYNSKHEALSVLKEMKELFPTYDNEKETYTSKIIK